MGSFRLAVCLFPWLGYFMPQLVSLYSTAASVIGCNCGWLCLCMFLCVICLHQPSSYTMKETKSQVKYLALFETCLDEGFFSAAAQLLTWWRGEQWQKKLTDAVSGLGGYFFFCSFPLGVMESAWSLWACASADCKVWCMMRGRTSFDHYDLSLSILILTFLAILERSGFVWMNGTNFTSFKCQNITMLYFETRKRVSFLSPLC